MIKFRTVTRFSQIVAIVLGVLIFLLGMYVGMRVEESQNEPVLTENVSQR